MYTLYIQWNVVRWYDAIKNERWIKFCREEKWQQKGKSNQNDDVYIAMSARNGDT